VKVALSGLGGDELFAGYEHFGWPEQLNGISSSAKDSALSKIFDVMPVSRPYTFINKLKCSSPKIRLSMLRQIFSDKEISQIVLSNLRQKKKGGWVMNYVEQLGIKNENTIEEITKYECKNYLLNTLLRDADALSMGNSLEVRPVLLDHRLVEWALALPASSKWRNGTAKAILKDAGADLLPKNFFLRPKTGFTLPVLRWLNTDLHGRFEETLNRKDSELFFTRNFLNGLVANVSNPRKNKGAWMIFVFLEWANVNKIKVHGG
jgi:asparagine synthase (glutamine-hydrolysing)